MKTVHNTNSVPNDSFQKLILTALFTALVCVATLSIRIPTPGTSGYIHPGDAVVILSGVILGPWWGFLAAGIGSAMADLLGGYMVYVPISLIIKGLVALSAGLIYQHIGKNPRTRFAAVALGGVADIVLVAGGYFIFEFFLYGAGAAASIPANLTQGVSGMLISCVLYPMLISVPEVRRLSLAGK